MKRALSLGLGALGVALLAGGAGYFLASHRMGGHDHGNGTTVASAPADGRKPLYWHDPMYPQQKFDKPGRSPFMDMDLVPVYGDAAPAAAGEEGVRIDPRVQQNLGIRTAKAERLRLEQRLEAVGSVAWNERDVAVVQARGAGFVEKLHVRATLDPVRAGQPLAELLVPEWVGAQEEFLAVRRMGAAAPEGLLEAARQRMRLAGMSDAQVALVESSGRTQARLVVTAPLAGVVSELAAREGMTVAAGAPLFRINGLGTVWVHAEIPEAMAATVRPGVPVEARATAFPDEVFKAKVTALLPEVNAATRTLRARIEVANPRGRLVPGMFVTVAFAPAAAREALVVPSEALIRTGKRTLVMVALEGGRFRPAEVEAGAESAGRTEIRRGLAEGDAVVVSGQFLLDSEASLKGIDPRSEGATGAAAR